MTVEERDIREKPEYVQELIGLGSRSTPTTVVNLDSGREIVIGFNRDKLSRLLDLSAGV